MQEGITNTEQQDTGFFPFVATTFWSQWIRLQMQHNIQEILKCSIKDFHFKGLNYVCFQFTPSLTIRLYITHPREELDTENVSIHNHLYDSQILVLSGWIKNRVYQQSEGETHNHYYLTSALHPDNVDKTIKLENCGKVGLKVMSERTLLPGDWHFQSHEEIHNVSNDPKSLTGFMVFEFPTVKQNSTIFSTKVLGETLPTPNCYNRFEEQELRDLVDELLKSMP